MGQPAGYYIIHNVCPETYAVSFATNKAVGSINSTDAALVNQWGVTHTLIERVRFLAGDIDNDNWVLSNDAYLIQSYFRTVIHRLSLPNGSSGPRASARRNASIHKTRRRLHSQ